MHRGERRGTMSAGKARGSPMRAQGFGDVGGKGGSAASSSQRWAATAGIRVGRGYRRGWHDRWANGWSRPERGEQGRDGPAAGFAEPFQPRDRCSSLSSRELGDRLSRRSG